MMLIPNPCMPYWRASEVRVRLKFFLPTLKLPQIVDYAMLP